MLLALSETLFGRNHSLKSSRIFTPSFVTSVQVSALNNRPGMIQASNSSRSEQKPPTAWARRSFTIDMISKEDVLQFQASLLSSSLPIRRDDFQLPSSQPAISLFAFLSSLFPNKIGRFFTSYLTSSNCFLVPKVTKLNNAFETSHLTNMDFLDVNIFT